MRYGLQGFVYCCIGLLSWGWSIEVGSTERVILAKCMVLFFLSYLLLDISFRVSAWKASMMRLVDEPRSGVYKTFRAIVATICLFNSTHTIYAELPTSLSWPPASFSFAVDGFTAWSEL